MLSQNHHSCIIALIITNSSTYMYMGYIFQVCDTEYINGKPFKKLVNVRT